MADEDRNFIDVAGDVSRNWSGEAVTPEGILNEFQLFGPAKRAGILDDVDADYRNADTSDLRKFSDMATLRRNMQKVHHALRKAGR
jgi:hypothetical protein